MLNALPNDTKLFENPILVRGIAQIISTPPNQSSDAKMPPIIRDGKHDAPLSFRFVEQCGRLVDTQTKRAVRSHAMREVRNRQKQKKQMRVNSLCQCSTKTPISPMPKREKTSFKLDSTDFHLPLVISKRCKHCSGLQFFESPPSPDVERLSPKITTLAVAQLDPFGTTAQVPASLAVRFSSELEVITSHSEYICRSVHPSFHR
jgi:hypothetical protein